MPEEVGEYLDRLPETRRVRMLEIRDTILGTLPGIEENVRYRMPTYEKDGNWVAMASQQKYISVYFCREDLVSRLRDLHSELN